VIIDGLSRREAAKRFGVHRNTITKMLSFSVPPGYRRRERPAPRSSDLIWRRETSPQQKALVSFPLAMHSQLRILSELHGIPMTQIIRDGVADRIALLLASSPPRMF
jgi:hypothetical protein